MHLGVAIGNLGFAMARPPDPAAHAALSCGLADEAERLGFHSVWVGDHLALPIEPTTAYPYGPSAQLLNPETSMLDPFAVLAAIAGRTRRIRLGFGVLVLPFRHPLIAAKLIATIDALSAGRVILGVGTGWMPEEFRAVGSDFAARGRSTDAALVYLKQAFATGRVDGMTIFPLTVQRPGPPIWIGGGGPRAMRRAVELGDGWDAPYVDPDALRDAVHELHQCCEEAGRDPASLTLSVRGLHAAAVDDDLIARYAALGVTELGVTLPVGDPPEAFEVLGALAARCPEHVHAPEGRYNP